MRKRIRWAILGISGVFLVFSSFTFYTFFIHPKMNETLLRQAENAVNSGITIEDAQNDFVSLEGEVEKETGQKNNPNSYSSSYLDIKSIGVGVDDKFIYYKVRYWEQIPTKVEKIANDVIRGNMIKLNITDKQGREQAVLVANYSWFLFNFSGFETYYFYEPTGIEEPEDKRFVHQDKDSKISGGPGTDYVIAAFPMEKLGLKRGQTIYMNFLGEAKSKKYVHASLDALKGKGKMGGSITWTIGSNQYQLDDNFFTNLYR